ncbi:MAG: hypothetical protein HY688_00005 [Chloroflexi bacterium]|nr:hypothetical protein [Chloroflexota bacterium]
MGQDPPGRPHLGALVLWQAWIAAGRPQGERSLGSYESFAEVMGGVLEVAGIHGFLRNLDRAYAEADQEVGAWAAFCSAWWEEWQERPITADLLFGLATRHRLLQHVWAGREEHGARTAFGKALAAMRDRVVGEFRVRRAGENAHEKVARWRLERAPTRTAAGVAGDTGGFPWRPRDG